MQCTSLHPRLALLTGTLEQALDDLWHTSLLTVLLREMANESRVWTLEEKEAREGGGEAKLRDK
jgi:hypothetical protein